EETRKVLLQEIFDLDEGERVWNEERRGAPDFGSHASARELDFILEGKLGHRLTFVERTLEKIGEGTYGLCDATGKPIPQGRLKAIPEAIYTLEAVKDSGVNTRPSPQRRGQKAQGISR
ncbi:MAG TPA: TraR/DksA C4-type zinc finger protein, partial [Rubrobacteraceae bacterium]|nr:TraR/DksA C4-type zinc finger protein [Rubrobacteraceae bacterium]